MKRILTLILILYAILGYSQGGGIELFEIAAPDSNRIVITKDVDGQVEQVYKPIAYLFDSTGITYVNFIAGTVNPDALNVFYNDGSSIVLPYDSDSTNEIELPAGGQVGQVLVIDQFLNVSWQDPEDELPPIGSEGQILKVVPSGTIAGNVLQYVDDVGGLPNADRVDDILTVAEVSPDSLVWKRRGELDILDNYGYVIVEKDDKLYKIDPYRLIKDYTRETLSPLRSNGNGMYTYTDEQGTKTTIKTGDAGADPCDGQTFLDYSTITAQAAGPLSNDLINITMLAGAVNDSGWSMAGNYKIVSYTQNCEIENPTHKILKNGVEVGPLLTNGKTDLSITGGIDDRITIKTISANNGAHCWHQIGIITEIACN